MGAVSLEVSGRETHLVPRQLPDVTDVVSGVVYARAAEPALFPAASRYVVHVSGGPEVDPFDVSATAPADPADVHIAGEDPTGLAVRGGHARRGRRGRRTRATTLLRRRAARGGALHARQRATLDAASARATLPASLVDEAGTLVVHRMHREALVARGLEGGELRFDFSRSVAYVRR